MLTITIPGNELYDEESNTFIKDAPDITLKMEHSLVSISKWESKWHKSFLSTPDKTDEEMIDYMRAMTITQHVDPNVYYKFGPDVVRQITEYIQNPMTATTFADENARPNRQIVTAEVIYYWMLSFNIPFECQKWHINRLLTLIRVCNAKTQKPKKMSKADLAKRNRELNAQRRAQLNTSG